MLQSRKPWPVDELLAKLISPTSTVGANGQNVRYKPAGLDPQTGAIWESPREIESDTLLQPVDAPTGGQPLPQPVNAQRPGAAAALSAPVAPIPIDAIRAKLAGLTANKGPLEANSIDPDAVTPEMRETLAEPYPGVLAPDDPRINSTRSWKAGYGVGETDPLKKEEARIRALAENPTSEVNPDGSVNTPHPMGKKKAALLGILMGMAKAAEGKDNPHWASVLAGGATGGVIGGVKPRAIQEWKRRQEVDFAQGELGEQQKIAMGQAKLEGEKAEARQRELAPEIAKAELERKSRFDNERLKIQKEVAEGRKSTAEATRELKQLEMQQRREDKQLDRESREKVAGIRSSASTAGDGTKRGAKLSESGSYYNQAKEIEVNADKLSGDIKKLEDGLKNIPEFIDVDGNGKIIQNPARDPHKAQLKELRDAQEAQKKEARGLYEKAAKARAEGEAIPETPAANASDPLNGKKWSKSQYRGKKPIAQAAKEAADRGAIVVD